MYIITKRNHKIIGYVVLVCLSVGFTICATLFRGDFNFSYIKYSAHMKSRKWRIWATLGKMLCKMATVTRWKQFIWNGQDFKNTPILLVAYLNWKHYIICYSFLHNSLFLLWSTTTTLKTLENKGSSFSLYPLAQLHVNENNDNVNPKLTWVYFLNKKCI